MSEITRLRKRLGIPTLKGSWNASTNTPTITSSVGEMGAYYIVSVAGTTLVDGVSDWGVGDWIIFDGTHWLKIDNSELVVSVAGKTGAVELTGSDITQDSSHRFVTDTEKSAWNAMSSGSVASVAGKTGAVTLETSDISGLITALSGKEPAITAGSSSQYLRGDKIWQTLDKTAVGLSNVPNTDATQRSNHTGTQTASTISDFNTAVDARIPVQSVAGQTGAVTLSKSDVGLGNVPNTDATTRSNHTGTQLSSTISDFNTAVDARIPVQSVSGKSGAVTLSASDVGLGNVKNLDQSDPANISQSSSYRFVSDTEKSTWNAKQSAITGAASSILTSNLLTDRILISDNTGKVSVSAYPSLLLDETDHFFDIEYPVMQGKVNLLMGNVGNLTELSSSVLTIVGGTSSVINPAGTQITVKQASASQDGFITSTNFNTFNAKLSPAFLFGSGVDGALTASSGTTTLTRDMYYSNVTLSGTAVIKTAGYKMFVSGTLDLTNAAAGAIQNTGGNGGNGGNGANNTGGTAGAAASALAAQVVGGGGTGPAGKVGATSSLAGTAGAAGVLSATPANGGRGGAGGVGATGSNSGGAGGAAGAAPAASTNFLISRYSDELAKASTIIAGGSSGGSGGSGGGGGSTQASSGGSGAGGTGGGVVYIAANTVSRGASTAAGAIQAKGGAGGNAGTTFGGYSSSAGGSAGGGGGGGGWVYLVAGSLTGATVTNMIDASGGNGGNGATGGTGVNSSAAGGGGGTGGDGGRITVINFSAGTISDTAGSAGTAGNAGNAASGTTPGSGGSGGAGNTFQVSL